jgi:hypothetical protein
MALMDHAYGKPTEPVEVKAKTPCTIEELRKLMHEQRQALLLAAPQSRQNAAQRPRTLRRSSRSQSAVLPRPQP